jgi:hypothetical protein
VEVKPTISKEEQEKVFETIEKHEELFPETTEEVELTDAMLSVFEGDVKEEEPVEVVETKTDDVNVEPSTDEMDVITQLVEHSNESMDEEVSVEELPAGAITFDQGSTIVVEEEVEPTQVETPLVSGDAQSNDEVLERMTEQATYQEPVSEPIISNVIENSSTMVEEKVEEMLEESNEDVVDVVETEESNSSVVMNQAPTTEAVESEVVVDSTEVKSTELQVEEPVSFEPKIEAKTVEKFEIDEEHYQAEMKRVIINNALAVADKGLLNTIVDSWKELVRFVGDETYGPIAHLLGEARVRVVGPGFIIVSYIHQAHVDRFYAQYSGVEDILAQILDEEFFIAAITEIEWVREKDNYITHKRRGEAYKEEALPSKDNYYKRIVVEEETVEEQEIDAIVNDAIKLFGHDIVNVK